MQKVKTILISDLSGTELGDGGQSVKFSVRGVDYEIDLSQAEADEFEGVLQRYVAAGRRVGGRRASGANSTAASRDRSQIRVIKAWLDEQGVDYPKRGRLPKALVEQWELAHRV